MSRAVQTAAASMRRNAVYSPALYLIFSQMYNPVIACQAPQRTAPVAMT